MITLRAGYVVAMDVLADKPLRVGQRIPEGTGFPQEPQGRTVSEIAAECPGRSVGARIPKGTGFPQEPQNRNESEKVGYGVKPHVNVTDEADRHAKEETSRASANANLDAWPLRGVALKPESRGRGVREQARRLRALKDNRTDRAP